MFEFFGTKRGKSKKSALSFLNLASKLREPALSAADTGSSEDSYYRYYDDESSLESYGDIDNEAFWDEEQAGELGIETSLSTFEMETMEFHAQETQIKELHRLVNIMSEEEKFDVPNEDMPAYKIRRRIATKVMAKKVSKGYLLLEESCKFCDMPLMEGKGKKECKVCPAIKKWMNKHAPNDDENNGEVNLCNSEASTDIPHQVVIAATASDGEERNERKEDEEHEDADELASSVTLDQTIIEDMAQVTRDVVRFVTSKRESGINALSPIPETLEVGGSGSTSNLENKSRDKERNAEERMTKREKKAIEDRATQIIKEARNRGGWNTSYDRISTLMTDDVHDKAFYQGVAEARAELIVMKARETLKRKGQGPTAPLTPMTQLRNKHRAWLSHATSKMRSWDAAIIIQSFARMVPARLAFIDHRSEKRTRLYRELLTGPWGPDEKTVTAGKVDVIFESRSKDMGENCDGDPEGEVHHSNSTTVEHTDSQHADSGDDAGCDGDDVQHKSVDKVLHIQSLETLKIVTEATGGDAKPNSVMPNVNSQTNQASDGLTLDNSPTTNQCHPGQRTRICELIDESATLPNAVPVVHNTNVVMKANAVFDTNVLSTKPVERKSTMQSASAWSSLPPNEKRNVFAKVACSFDDAVSKAVSNVKSLVACTGGDGQFEGAIDIGLGRFKSASVVAPSSDGTYFDYESQRKAASYCIMYRTSLGWIIANQSCSRCQMPMMVRPDDGELLCVVCDETDAMDNATLGTMPYSVDSDHNNSTIRGGSSSVDIPSGNNTKPIDPEPEGSIRPLIEPETNVVASANKAKPIDPEPLDALEPSSKPMPRRAKSKHALASDSISLEPSSLANLPPMHMHNEMHQRWGASNVDMRPALPPNQQWLMANQGCPRCNLPMTGNAFDNKQHCPSCGMIVYNPAQTSFFAPKATTYTHVQRVSLLDDDSHAGINSGDVNPFSLAHQRMISNQHTITLKHHGTTGNPKLQQSFGRAFDPQNSVAISKFSHVAQSSFSQNLRTTHSLNRGHPQSFGLHSVEHPTPNRMIAQFNAPTPNANRMKKNEPQHNIYNNIEHKENSYGDANMGYHKKPLTAVEEAKIRMENAQNAVRTKNLHY
ncbi:hypothetical protein HJC23_009966 [Cyclotella cryptica]|uniref:Uncharacterized protein n=1 Tax=Cyclotella cryptica TaxID=29204 RepID=A0ABD3QA79_9STRA